MRVKTTLVAAALAGLITMLLSGPAAADVIRVHEGESIQAAVDEAGPGDTVKLGPGTYQESIQVKTDQITLKGAGADDTVIEPGGPSEPSLCGGIGVCVTAAVVTDPNLPPVVDHEVAGVRIKDLKVRGFENSGVFFFATEDQRVNDVRTEDAGEYGIAAFETTGGRYWDNVTNGSGEAGLYVGDSANADALVRDNLATGNGIGIFIRDAAHGLVEDNRSFDNCIGMLFLDTPDDPADPRPNSDWLARDNVVNHNNKACSGEEGDSSGIGIAVDGAHRITLVGNTANGNQPTGTTTGSAGIAVLTEPGFPLETDNVVRNNTAFGNQLDLLWDQQGDNTFSDNRCETSDPDGLCESGRGHGHHGDGHHGDGHHGDGHHGDGHHADGHHADGHKGHHGGKHKHGKHKSKRHDD